MNVETIDRILSDALHALGSAQAELRKNAKTYELGDVLSKAADDELVADPRTARGHVQAGAARVLRASRRQASTADVLLERIDELNARMDQVMSRDKAKA